MPNLIRAMLSGLSQPVQWLIDALDGGSETNSGIKVTPKSALSYPPVWHAVSKITGHIGQMPLVCRKRMKEASEPAKGHPAYRLLKAKPNRYQSAIMFKETLMVHALLMGNGRAAIVRDAAGNPIELLPMMPDRTVTCLHEGEKWHVTNIPADDPLSEQVGEKESRVNYKIHDRDVLHIPGLSLNGVEGLTLIEVCKETFGTGLAGQKATGKNFKNSAKPSIVIQAPPGMFRNPEDAKQFIDAFNEAHAGLDETGKAGLLREGMTLSTVPTSAKDAEWLAQRKFERQETALIFMLEQILGDDSSVSYNSLEQKNLAYLSSCLMKWLVKWEQECDEKLLSGVQKVRDSHFFKFNFDALLRADSQTRMLTLTGYLQHRVMNPNQVRELLDMPPYEGGDKYENPAITPGNHQSDEGDTETDEAVDLARRAISNQIRDLIKIESQRVRDAATKQTNFNDWLDKFYGEWAAKLVEKISPLGADALIVAEYCERSKADMVAITEQVTQSQLSAAVTEATNQWPARADRMTNQILEKELSYAAI